VTSGVTPIPAKRYFTIGEVAELCGVKPHVLRYWEQEFTQLRPMKRRGNRRYYQHHEVLMIRRIRDLLYDQGFTISGARNKMQELLQAERELKRGQGSALSDLSVSAEEVFDDGMDDEFTDADTTESSEEPASLSMNSPSWGAVRRELLEIRELLAEPF
jgi:DNA-binding transcriptional MerR regulator